MIFPPLMSLLGAKPSHEVKWFSVWNPLMLVPISETIGLRCDYVNSVDGG
jgi:hypothetical protein